MNSISIFKCLACVLLAYIIVRCLLVIFFRKEVAKVLNRIDEFEKNIKNACRVYQNMNDYLGTLVEKNPISVTEWSEASCKAISVIHLHGTILDSWDVLLREVKCFTAVNPNVLLKVTGISHTQLITPVTKLQDGEFADCKKQIAEIQEKIKALRPSSASN